MELWPHGLPWCARCAATFQPYDASEALGDTLPTTPKPPKRPNEQCGAFGAIMRTAITILVAKFLVPPIPIVGEMATSLISQGISTALGLQRRIDFKQVGIAGINGLVRMINPLEGLPVVGAMTTNAATQGLSKAVGLQSKFSWSAVAAAGVMDGVTRGVDALLGTSSLSTGVRDSISTFAGAMAGAATRSAISGDSFGDALIASLPDVIGTIAAKSLIRGIEGSVHSRTTNSSARARTGAAAHEARHNADPKAVETTMGNEIVVTARSLFGRGAEFNADGVNTDYLGLVGISNPLSGNDDLMLRPVSIADAVLADVKYSATVDKKAAELERADRAKRVAQSEDNEDGTTEIIVTGRRKSARRASGKFKAYGDISETTTAPGVGYRGFFRENQMSKFIIGSLIENERLDPLGDNQGFIDQVIDQDGYGGIQREILPVLIANQEQYPFLTGIVDKLQAYNQKWRDEATNSVDKPFMIIIAAGLTMAAAPVLVPAAGTTAGSYATMAGLGALDNVVIGASMREIAGQEQSWTASGKDAAFGLAGGLVFRAASPFLNKGMQKLGFGLPEYSALSPVANPSVATGDNFIGPLIGKSGYRTSAEFAEAVGMRYQNFVDDGYARAFRAEAEGRLVGLKSTRVGDAVDRFSQARLKAFLRSEGIAEGPGKMIQLNRYLRDPSGSGLYVRPDVRIPAAGRIYDASVGFKSSTSQQITGFGQYSGGNHITVTRPGRVDGSYSIVP
jgi:hypothetical protein